MNTFRVNNSTGHILLSGPAASGKTTAANALAKSLSDQIRNVCGTSSTSLSDASSNSKVVTLITELLPSGCSKLNGPLDQSTKVKARWVACTNCLGNLPNDTVERFSCLILTKPRVDDAHYVAKFLGISPEQADAVLQAWNPHSDNSKRQFGDMLVCEKGRGFSRLISTCQE